MPLYEYECDACGRRFELIRRFSDPAVDTCTLCGKGPVRRLLSSPAIQFKGSGWYITDYARKAKSEKTAETPSEKKTDTAGKSDAAPSSPTSASTSAGSDPGAGSTKAG